MLLNEILTKPIKNIRTAKSSPDINWNKQHSEYNPPKQYDHLGGGAQANAFHHSRSGSVVKQITLDGDSTDPSYQFLRLALKHQDNPYFPKIYNIKGYKRDGVIQQLLVHMEKLNEITKPDIQRLFELMGLPDPSKNNYNITRRMLSTAFANAEDRADIAQNTKDPKFKQALRLLEPLFRHYIPDMRVGNIMVRSNGQLVIIDPIFYMD